MARKGTYYIGRVLKLGVLDQEKLKYALVNSAVVQSRGNSWTFIDVHEYNQPGDNYIFGKLSKFAPEGEVDVVDTTTKSGERRIEPNLIIASSPFVYIPEHSGLCFLNVSNNIDQPIFIRRFCEIIKKTHGNFFVECDIDLISDLKTFAARLAALDGIYKINARVSPPNPLFSPLWKPLEEYLRKRNTDKMSIIEDAPIADNLETRLPELIEKASNQSESEQFIPDYQIDIGDAAILMAADGYGHGTVRGRRNEETVVIKTSETALNFSFDTEPEPYDLYLKALEILERVKKARHMEHGK